MAYYSFSKASIGINKKLIISNMSSPVEGQQQQPPKEELTEKELAKLEKKRAKEEAKRQKVGDDVVVLWYGYCLYQEEAKAARLAEEKRRLEGPDVPYSEVVTGDQKFGHTFIQSQVKSLGRKFTKVTHLDATMKDQKVSSLVVHTIDR